jgi:hypothetical protein
MIVLPAMPPEQTASWHGVLDLYELLNSGWTLIGGQLVHLHCAERGSFPARPTDDADTVIDVRAEPTILRTFTAVPTDLGFESAGISVQGLQHCWKRGDASLDVLLPDGVGERAGEEEGSGDRRRPAMPAPLVPCRESSRRVINRFTAVEFTWRWDVDIGSPLDEFLVRHRPSRVWRFGLALIESYPLLGWG